MSDRGVKDGKGRRAVLASIAAGAACSLPSQWKRPVVDSVLLPAHAQTSVNPTSAIVTTAGALACLSQYTGTANAVAATTGITGASVLYALNLDFFATCTDPNGGTTSTFIATNSFTGITSFSDTIFPTQFTTLGPTSSFTLSATFTTTVTV